MSLFSRLRGQTVMLQLTNLIARISRFFLCVGFLVAVANIGLAQSETKITSIKRTYKDNSTWSWHTDKGTGSLKRVFSDGSTWELIIPGQRKYVFTQTFKGDNSEWIVKQGENEVTVVLSFSGDFNEWRTGDPKDFLYTKATYKNNFAEWKAENGKGTYTVKSVFSDGSEWKVTDNLKESSLTKIASLFGVLVSAQLR